MDKEYSRNSDGYYGDDKFRDEAIKILNGLDKQLQMGYSEREIAMVMARVKEAHYAQIQMDKFFGITK